MAHATAVTPMRPLTPAGGAAGCPTMELYDVDGDANAGDIIIFTGGKADVAADAATVGTIVGVATGDGTAANDPILVALALPGVQFVGHTIEAADDQVGAYAQDVGVKCGVILNTVDSQFCLNIENTTQKVAVGLRYARQNNATQDSDPLTAGVGVTNPRVVFMWIGSFFTDVT